MNCIFCKIVNGDIPANVIYEDEMIMAFADANPRSLGHTLIVPKEHTLDVTTIPEDTINYIMKKAKEIIKILEKKYHPDGFVLVQNNGIVEEVKHFHLHIIPSYKNDSNKCECKYCKK